MIFRSWILSFFIFIFWPVSAQNERNLREKFLGMKLSPTRAKMSRWGEEFHFKSSSHIYTFDLDGNGVLEFFQVRKVDSVPWLLIWDAKGNYLVEEEFHPRGILSGIRKMGFKASSDSPKRIKFLVYFDPGLIPGYKFPQESIHLYIFDMVSGDWNSWKRREIRGIEFQTKSIQK